MKAIGLLFGVALLGAWILWSWPHLQDPLFWQQQASPGPLTPGHAFLKDRCAACHTSIKGVEPSNCIVCHANQTELLQRQATAFHASIGACAQCHREHDTSLVATPPMDHAALASIGLQQLSREATDSEARGLHHQLVSWMGARAGAEAIATDNPHLSAGERVLDCATCHASKDRHWKLLGRDCGLCHATSQWTLAEFRHPPPSSQDCAQCHQAPPSHYMEHFKMVSMPIAGEPGAQVRECYRCHQTTAWNDIRNVGLYKHH